MRNYCDYDAIVHYAPGTFGSKYKTDVSGKLKEIDRDLSLSENDINSFQNDQYRTYETTEPLILYRLFGKYQMVEDGRGEPKGARINGRFASTEFAESLIDAKSRRALDPKWLNTKMYEAKLQVPTGTKVSIGVVAPVTLKTGVILTGGADQVLLPVNWSEKWILGYRRVSSWQLQIVPTYWPEKPEEITVGIKNLYPDICPRCCFHRTRKLSEEEQFIVIGRLGGRYTMKNVCLNPECEYYW